MGCGESGDLKESCWLLQSRLTGTQRVVWPFEVGEYESQTSQPTSARFSCSTGLLKALVDLESPAPSTAPGTK